MFSFLSILLASGGILCNSQASLGSEEMTVLFPCYAEVETLSDEAVLGPIHNTTDAFPLSSTPKKLELRIKDDCSPFRFC